MSGSHTLARRTALQTFLSEQYGEDLHGDDDLP